MKLRSVNVGLPRTAVHQGREIATGIFKQPLDGAVQVRRTNLAGDGQADLRVLEEGEIRAGDAIERTALGPHRIGVAEIFALRYGVDPDPGRRALAVQIPALSPRWRAALQKPLSTSGAD
jgi:MOSC domain-containing protein YiiM